MSGRSRLDRAVDSLAAWGRAVAVIGLVFVLVSSAWSVLRYRDEYGTWQPFVSFPARFRACGGATYLAARSGPYDGRVVAESTVRVDHTPGAMVWSSQPCHTTGCPDRCGIPTVVVVRDGDETRIYSLSGGP